MKMYMVFINTVSKLVDKFVSAYFPSSYSNSSKGPISASSIIDLFFLSPTSHVLNQSLNEYKFKVNIDMHHLQRIKEKYVQSSLCIHGGLVSGPPWIPKSTDAQVPNIKWQSAVGPPYPQMHNPQIMKANYIQRGIYRYIHIHTYIHNCGLLPNMRFVT